MLPQRRAQERQPASRQQRVRRESLEPERESEQQREREPLKDRGR